MNGQRVSVLMILLTLSAWPQGEAKSEARETFVIRAGDHQREMVVDGLERTYLLHVPRGFRLRPELPLLVVLHGGEGTGQKARRQFGFDPHADREGFLVAYPDACQGSGWNDGRGTTESAALGIDDVSFILRMIEEISTRFSVDGQRVYVTGASNGGMMSYRLGCESRGVFAGVAPVIANIPEPLSETCSPQSPLALMSINGDEDPLVPFEGGEVCKGIRLGCARGYVLSAEESAGLFAQANGCSEVHESEALPLQVADGTWVERRTYVGCHHGAEVVSYVVHGGGHTWPPKGPWIPAAGNPTGNLDATQVIVDSLLGSRAIGASTN